MESKDWTPPVYDGWKLGDGCTCCESHRIAFGPSPSRNETFETEFQSMMCLNCGFMFLLVGESIWEV